jgi:hypothetical protein
LLSAAVASAASGAPALKRRAGSDPDEGTLVRGGAPREDRGVAVLWENQRVDGHLGGEEAVRNGEPDLLESLEHREKALPGGGRGRERRQERLEDRPPPIALRVRPEHGRADRVEVRDDEVGELGTKVIPQESGI